MFLLYSISQKNIFFNDDIGVMLKLVLRELIGISDVQSAAVSGLDGFIIEMEKTGDLDPDAVGAMTSSSVRVFEEMGKELGKGRLKQAVLSHRNGDVILCPLTDDEFLVVTAKPGANTGRLVHELGKKKDRLLAVM